MISTIFLILAGMLKGLMDTISHHWVNCILNTEKLAKYEYWLNPEKSKHNKYIDNDPTKPYKKLFWIIPRPVLISDLWHLAQSIMLICFSLAVGFALIQDEKIIPFVIINCWWPYNFALYLLLYFLWFRASIGLGFDSMYKYILIKKDGNKRSKKSNN